MKTNITAIIDTETIGLWPKHIYDFGYVIQDNKGKIIFEASHLVEEIITDPKKMMGAFYAKKIFSHYLPLLDAGMIDIKPFSYIYDEFIDACETHKVNILSAYNLGFDLRALQQTKKFLRYNKFYEKQYKLLDLWQYACESILNRPTYKNLATENNWISPAGNFRTNAEAAYRYISGNTKAVEAHTALCDARIESEILNQCNRQKKRKPYGIIDKSPWRLVNKNQ